MKQRIKQRTSCLVMAIGFIAALALSGCSKEGDTPADSNPGSEIRLTSGVQVQSRAATAPDTQIADGEPVAVYVDEAASPATQLYGDNVLTADGHGGLSGGTAMYFPASGKKVDIYAFHTNATTLTEAFPTSIEHSVAADQKGGYVSSDLLYAARTGVKRSASAVDLTFYHLLAKVAVVLKPGTGMTATDLDGAVVTIENTRLKATFTPDKTVTMTDPSARAAMIAPTAGTNPVAAITIPTAMTTDFSSVASYGEGIIVPQTVDKDQPFIRVKLANGTTLSYKLDVNTTFESGKKHTYQITVNFTELTATATIGDWTHVAAVDDVATMPEPIGDKTPAQAAVGDFYMNDGSLVGKDENLTDVQQAACLGIVLKVSRDVDGNWKDDCGYKLKDGQTEMSTVHGYVLALYDANGGSYCQWGYGTQVGTSQESTTGFYGYKDTQKIKARDDYSASNFPAAYWTSVDYETRESGKYADPTNSSGWFLPSGGQCQYWYNNRDILLAQVRKATGNSSYKESYYWSSSEHGGYPSSFAWYLHFGYGSMGWGSKDVDRYVRSCLAF